MQRSALCRSRRELSNAYLLAKFGFDTAENEPCQICPIEPCQNLLSSQAAFEVGQPALVGTPRRARRCGPRRPARRTLRRLSWMSKVPPVFSFRVTSGPPDAAIEDPLVLRSFGKLVLGCIEANVHTHFTAFFEIIYKIRTLLHRSKLIFVTTIRQKCW